MSIQSVTSIEVFNFFSYLEITTKISVPNSIEHRSKISMWARELRIAGRKIN